MAAISPSKPRDVLLVRALRRLRAGWRRARQSVRTTLGHSGWLARLRSGNFRIAVQTVVINTYDGFVWGDECMARGLSEALSARGFATDVVSSSTHDIASIGADVMIAMYPTGNLPGLPYAITLPANCLNLYWAQVPGHYTLAQADPRFGGFMFASRREMVASSAPRKLWLPMSADASTYRPQEVPKEIDVVFCANHIAGRSRERLADFLGPILETPGARLVIRGSGWEATPYQAFCDGPIHPSRVPDLYSRARVVLSIHGDAHFAADMPTSRLFEAAACGSAIISDDLPTAREIFGDTVCWTSGGSDLRRKLEKLLGEPGRLRHLGKAARTTFLEGYTFDHHAGRIAEFVRTLVTKTL